VRSARQGRFGALTWRASDVPPFRPRARVHVLATPSRASAAQANPKPSRDGPQKPRGAERRKAPVCESRACEARRRALYLLLPRLRGRVGRGAPAFRRSTAALVAASERRDSAQAVLYAIERERALPAPSIALKRGTPRAGHDAGGNDAQAARERSYKPRPQEPHPLHQSAVTGRRPSMSERCAVSDAVTEVKDFVAAKGTRRGAASSKLC